MSDVIQPDSFDVSEFKRIIRKVDGIRGPGIANHRASINFSPLAAPIPEPVSIPPFLVFGKPVSPYSPGATFIELTPCKTYLDDTATGAPNIHAIIVFNGTTPVAPPNLIAAVGDVLAAVVLDGANAPPLWLLISPPLIPPPTADYQVLQAKSGVYIPDNVRAH